MLNTYRKHHKNRIPNISKCITDNKATVITEKGQLTMQLFKLITYLNLLK